MATTVPRDRLNAAIAHGKHLAPLYKAARDHGCVVGIVPQGVGPFEPPPADRPAIIILGDDLHDALGPAAFHAKSLRQVLKDIRLAAVVACEPLPEIYESAARHAVLLRKNVVIVETRAEQEIAWVNLIRSIAPDTAFIIGSVEGGTA